MNLAQEIVELESVRFSSREPDRSPRPRLQRWLWSTAFGLLLILPLCFGGVHPRVYLFGDSLVFLSALLLAFGLPRVWAATLRMPLTGPMLLTVSLTLGFAAVRYIFPIPATGTHPVLGTAIGALDRDAFQEGILAFGFFTLSTILFSGLLIGEDSSVRRSLTILTLLGFVVSCIGLSHWLYDDGRLFWTFAPDNVFRSDRARWPFVNSNHLAHFLLPLFFLALVDFHNKSTSPKKPGKNDILSWLGSDQITRLMWRVILVATIVLTIIATLSRGSWSSLTIALACLLYMIPGSEQAPVRTASGRRRRKSTNSRMQIERLQQVGATFVYYRRPILLIGALFLLLTMLGEQASDLVAGRIEYGLLYSQSDMRWQILQDTIPMFLAHPLFGVGLGSWALLYPQFMSPMLTGMNPVYLHSDPAQLLVELGIFGSLPIVLFALWVGTSLVRASCDTNLSPRWQSLARGLFCGLLGLVLASLVDFPFRIPAIMLLTSVLLALTNMTLLQARRAK